MQLARPRPAFPTALQTDCRHQTQMKSACRRWSPLHTLPPVARPRVKNPVLLSLPNHPQHPIMLQFPTVHCLVMSSSTPVESTRHGRKQGKSPNQLVSFRSPKQRELQALLAWWSQVPGLIQQPAS